MFRIVRRQLSWLILDPKFYVAVCLSLIYFLYNEIGLIKFALYINEPLNIFEGFIQSSSGRVSITISLLALIFLLSDMPYNNSEDIFCIFRISRGKWILSKIIYVIVYCFLHYAIIAAVTAIVAMPFAYSENVWSNVFNTMCFNNPELSQLKFGISYYAPNVMQNLSPFAAFGISYILNALYAVLMSLIMMFINLIVKKHLGLIVVCFSHGLGYVSMLYFSHDLHKSLFAMSLLTEHSFGGIYEIGNNMPTLFESFAALCVPITAVILLFQIMVYNNDILI